LNANDTICAIATAPGGAARGMVRLSGPGAIDVVSKIFRDVDEARLRGTRFPTAISGKAQIRLDNEMEYALPCDAFLWPTTRSYTREPVAELHTLGSPPLLQALVAAACEAGARLAEPGEFTLRAFLAGRIDLTQAEAVLGVIDARSTDELNTALTQLAGGLAQPLLQLRNDLLQLLAELEAGLDFVEEDIEFIPKSQVLARLNSASLLLADVARKMASRGTVTSTAQVALVGLPNAGKSSLFNALVARLGRGIDSTRSTPAVALVSPQRGTTRDYLTALIEVDELQYELIDTAGVDVRSASSNYPQGEETTHPASGELAAPAGIIDLIDTAAQSLAAERRAEATIRVCCVDVMSVSVSTWSLSQALPRDLASCDLVVLTKCDLMHVPPTLPSESGDVKVIAISSHSGLGIDELCAQLRDCILTEAATQHRQLVASTAERCRESIRLAAEAIARSAAIVEHQAGDEIAAAELRNALAELGKVVGTVYTDDLLDRVFKTFCIGK